MQVHHELEGRDDFCPIKAIGSDPTVPYSFMPAMDLGTWASGATISFQSQLTSCRWNILRNVSH